MALKKCLKNSRFFMFAMVKPHKSITTSLIIKIEMNIFILSTGLHGGIINGRFLLNLH